MSVRAASVELNQSIRQTYLDIAGDEAASIVDPDTRKRHVLGAWVERRAAEKIAAAKKNAAAAAADTARATKASLAERQRNPQKWRKGRKIEMRHYTGQKPGAVSPSV